MFSEISLKLCQTNWNVAIINVNVVVDGLSSQITVYTCLTIDIWTQWRRRTSTQFYALQCHPSIMTGFQSNWYQKFSTLLWTPLAHRQITWWELCNAHNFMLRVRKMTLSPRIFLEHNIHFEMEEVNDYHDRRSLRPTCFLGVHLG
jgi:hypothetical protein